MKQSLVCLLEEKSARELLETIIPKITTNIQPTFLTFEGKQDLDKKIEKRIKHWNDPNALFLILRDQDQEDCKNIKNKLQEKVNKTNKQRKTCIRIACKELESFYLGDLNAIQQGLNITTTSTQKTKKFRNPDNHGNPSEEINKLTKSKYKKIAGSREISNYLDLSGANTSTSFNQLITGIRKLVTST